MKPYAILIHGGAGTVSKTHFSKWKAEAYRQALKRAYTVGFMVLQKGGTALQAVKEAIVTLEDCELFNAGKGSVFTHSGDIEMDAALMDGKNLAAGAVAGVRLVKNPIALAEQVLRKSKHVLISGEQALDYARKNGLDIESPEYFHDDYRYQQWQKALVRGKTQLDHDNTAADEKFGTVGAVALDKRGNLAAGTSTGGMVNKQHGRIGDSPLIGIGTYANNQSCAVSCTGHGEYFIRAVVAHELSSRMLYLGESLEAACQQVVHVILPKLGGRGGLIGIDANGNFALPFNTKGMYRGGKHSNAGEWVGIFK